MSIGLWLGIGALVCSLVLLYFTFDFVKKPKKEDKK